jgi:hypothetical protein
LDFQPFTNGKGEINIELHASYFEPCIAIPNKSIGYGIGMVLRGEKTQTAQAFRMAVEKLGYPLRVDVPALLPIPFTENYFGSVNEFDSRQTNRRGWKVAKKVIKETGAELITRAHNICRFPYNLFLWDVEGKIIKDGIVQDPRWNKNVLEEAVAHGQVKKIIEVKNIEDVTSAFLEH